MMSDMQSVRFQRANYIVSDLDRALVLYRDVLGFDVEFIKEGKDDSYSYDVFEIDRTCKMRWATLNTRSQTRVMALTEVKGAPLTPAPFPRRCAIVLEVADVDGVLKRAKEHQFKVYKEDRLETHDGRVGREIGIADDDGNLVVIYHIPKT